MAGCSNALCSDQVNAFKFSTNVSPGDLILLISSVLAVIYLLWLTWIAYAAFKEWQQGRGDLYETATAIVRGAVIALVLGYYFHP